MNLQDPYVALKAIYDIINHLGMIYMKFKSEKKLKRIWFSPGVKLWLGKQTSIGYFNFIFPFNILSGVA
jgi:hypothetical protein